MNIHQTKETLNFIKNVIEQGFESTERLWRFISEFAERYRKEEEKLPYHINLIDELHADENAHSRILAKLLRQEMPKGEFEILKSFIQYLKEKSISFGNINIENPEITQETERIDLWVRDRDYAIVIENKIHWAPDQDKQLARYIDSTKKEFKEEQIYVIYLSPTYDKEPDEQTWGKYKETFKDRYLHLSFREDILSWLTNKVLPNVRLKDKFLSSALEQYIDHLEGKFDLRTINNNINMDIQEFIKQELGLNESPQNNIAKIIAKQEEIKKVNNQLQLLKDSAEKEIFQDWQMFFKKNYPDCQEITTGGVGLVIPIKNTEVRVVASIDGQQLYCQVDTQHLEDEKLPQEVIEKVGNLLPRKSGNNTIWKYLPRYAYDETYELMIKVIKILIN